MPRIHDEIVRLDHTYSLWLEIPHLRTNNAITIYIEATPLTVVAVNVMYGGGDSQVTRTVGQNDALQKHRQSTVL